MNNPFATLDLHLLRIKTIPTEKRMPDLAQQLELVNISKPNGVRNRVILLLRHKYKLRPSDISALNISDVDLNGGIIHIFRHPKKRIVVIDECDFLDLRRWSAVRKLYESGVDAFFISMHWTRGRTEPYKRISVRGVFQVVQKYASNCG